MQVFVLSDNTAGAPNFLAEHGLSLLVRTADGDMLMDVGQGIAAMHNMELLRVSLDGLQGVILSHGHYDHTAGLPLLLTKKAPVKVCAHPWILEDKYYRIGESKRFIGIPWRREYLETLGADFELESSPRELLPGMTLTGEIPRVTDFELGDPNLVVDRGGDLFPDPFLDDQALVIDDPQGLVIILGCAHAGIINTITYARQITGKSRIRAAIGGSHLAFLSQEQLERTIEELKMMEPELLAFSHCTGQVAARRLSQEFGDGFVFNQTGTVINI